MIKIFNNNESKEMFLDDYKNPFDLSFVKRVNFSISEGIFGGKVYYKAYVEFRASNTEGRQKFESDSFMGLVFKVDGFLKSLE